VHEPYEPPGGVVDYLHRGIVRVLFHARHNGELALALHEEIADDGSPRLGQQWLENCGIILRYGVTARVLRTRVRCWRFAFAPT